MHLFLAAVLSQLIQFLNSEKRHNMRFRHCTSNDSAQTLFFALETKSFKHWDYSEAPVKQRIAT